MQCQTIRFWTTLKSADLTGLANLQLYDNEF